MIYNRYMWLAMKERYLDEKNPLVKNLMPPVQAYMNRQECSTVEEIEAIEGDADQIHLEALMARERILVCLNKKFSELPKQGSLSYLTVVQYFLISYFIGGGLRGSSSRHHIQGCSFCRLRHV